MFARTLAGVILAGLVIWTVIGLPNWAAVLAAAAFAVAVVLRLARRPADVVLSDASGERLNVGDTVRAGAGFDGPMELSFGWGVVVKVGPDKAHVRFNDIPGQIHPVTPSGLRRVSSL
jgi:hypothetical protein